MRLFASEADAIITRVNSQFCTGCGSSCEPSDNFCRRCGSALAVEAPVLRTTRLPALRQRRALPPSLVGSVAVLALGTTVEWVARRLAGQAARAAGRALIGGQQSNGLTASPRPARTGDDISVDEFFYVREVRIRR
jgi:hypothetical protein